MQKGKVMFIASSYFPYGQAYSARLMNFARLFNYIGYDIHVIAEYANDIKTIKNKIYNFEDFTYEVIGDTSKKYRYFQNNIKVPQALKRYLANNKPEFVVVSLENQRCYKAVKKICHQNGVKVIRETCEWYNITSYKLGKLDYRYRSMQKYIENDLFKSDGVIAISRLLENHYKQHGNKVLRIPTIVDTKLLKADIDHINEKINLIHAGTAVGSDHKEELKNIFKALLLFKDEKTFEFNIYGSTEENVLNNIDGDIDLLRSLDGIVKIHGKIPQAEVHNAYAAADYSIIMRPQRRSSNAGFPTKLVESLVAGTPVISNDTGDIGLYLQTGLNGILTEDSSVQSIAKSFKTIAGYDEETTRNMRIEARKTAETCFDYRVYSDLILKLIQEVNCD